MNPELRDTRPNVDRVLLAAALLDEGHYRAAHLIVDSLVGAVSYDLAAIADKLREYQDTLDKARLCKDDPRYFVDLYEDDRVPGSLLDYSEWRCAELDTDAAQLLAEIVRLAEEIAAKAESVRAAA